MRGRMARCYLTYLIIIAMVATIILPMPDSSQANGEIEEEYTYVFGEDLIINGSGSPQVFVDGNDVVRVVWWDDLDRWGAYMSRSTGDGKNMTSTIKLFDGSGYVHIDENGFIYAVQSECAGNRCDENDTEMYFIKSINGGVTFTTPVKINDNFRTSSRYDVEIAVDNQENIYLAWIDERNLPDETITNKKMRIKDIYFSQSNNGGETFSKNIPINDDAIEIGIQQSNRTNYEPELAIASDGNVYASWVDCTHENDTVYIVKLIGDMFSDKHIVDTGSAAYRDISMGIGEDDTIYFSYEEWWGAVGGGYHISGMLCSSSMSWTTFTDSNNLPNVGTPKMVVKDERIFILGTYIGFTFSYNGGANFSQPTQSIQDYSPYTLFEKDPDIAVDSQDNVYIVWRQETEEAILSPTDNEMEIRLDKGVKTLVPPPETTEFVPPGLRWIDIQPWLAIGAIATIIAVPVVWMMVKRR